MKWIGATIGITGAALFFVGLCWLRFFALTFSDFAYSGLCLGAGAAVGSVGGLIYQKARAASASHE
jgi:hypothetical protein